MENPDTNALEAPTDVREDLIQTAIKFLQNPNVIKTGLAQKQNFLKRKGLTDREIQVACERSGAYQHHEEQQQTRTAPQLPPPVTYGPLQVSLFDRVREVVHNIAIFSIVAYFIHKIYKNYIEPFLFGRRQKSIEERIDDVNATVSELKTNLESVKTEISRITHSSDNGLDRQLTDIKSDVSTVKGLLLSRKQFPSVSSNPVVPPSIPAWQMSSIPSDADQMDGDHDRKDEEMEMGSGSGSEPEHCTKTSESSLEIIYSSRDCDSESCTSRKSKEDNEKN